jgi:hypothetical protein
MNMHSPLTMADVINLGARRAMQRHKACPWCQQVPTSLAPNINGTYYVGCTSDECHDKGIVAQASGDTADAAWAAWDGRP